MSGVALLAGASPVAAVPARAGDHGGGGGSL